MNIATDLLKSINAEIVVHNINDTKTHRFYLT